MSRKTISQMDTVLFKIKYKRIQRLHCQAAFLAQHNLQCDLSNVQRIYTTKKITINSVPPSQHDQHTVILERYIRDPDGCQGSMLACELHVSEFPEMTLVQDVSLAIQGLSGQTYDWAITSWRVKWFSDYSSF